MDESRPRRRQPVPLGVPGGQGLRPEPGLLVTYPQGPR
jgi:hypothetical protein